MEMNIFVPQSIQSMIELSEIADVKRQLISPRMSTPIIGLVQDGILGAYNLTAPSIKIDWRDAMNIISYTTIDDLTLIKKNTEYSGASLFSLIIPSKINISNNNIEIKEGELTRGQITNVQIGAKKKNSIIHLIWDEYGMDKAKEFIDNTQRLVNNFNLLNGFTCGIGDLEIPMELEMEMKKMFETKKLEVDHLITEMENNPDLLDKDIFEESIYNTLNTIRDDVSKLIMKNLAPENNFNIMISSGAKGGPINMGQMVGCVGQQACEGVRIKKSVNGRTLPYFHQNDDSAIARGFIEQSFLRGIHPINFMFQNISSREGIMDTAIKSVTGDTPIIIIDKNVPKYIKIGDWIDRLLEQNAHKVLKYLERDMELLNLDEEVHIPTVDDYGNVTWSAITAITRHDPGKELYRITTKGGRCVIVTESKSLLIWNKKLKQLVQTHTPTVVVGDLVPVTMNLLPPQSINTTCNPTIINPQQLINATNDTIKNALNKYITSVGKIKHHCLEFITESSDFANQLNILFSRLGIYGKLSSNILTIENHWVMKLKKIIRNDLLAEIIENDNHKHELIEKDIVLDEIIAIEILGVGLYPKVYDLTIPETLNFCLANGLHVVDTAESGYIQRKLIKSMEDAMVKYDLTVRNANNTIIQFIYGDSGVDTTKQYEHILKIITMSDTEVTENYKFTKEQLGKTKFSTKNNDDYCKQLIEMRNLLRYAIVRSARNQLTLKQTFMLPVNLTRIINNNKSGSSTKSDLEPDYILQKLNEITKYDNTKLICMNTGDIKNQNSFKNMDDQVSKTVFKIALHEYLAPKVSIFVHKLSKEQFDIICDRIIESFNNDIVSVGEMIGTIAAQSIGEPVTQMTLNSVDWEEEIIISDNGCFKVVKIGEFTDKLIEENLDKVEHVGDIKDKEMGDTYYLDIKDKNISAISVNEDGKVSWNIIEAVTKHLPMNTDGTSDLVKITTEMGRTTTATKAKSFLTRINNKVVPIRGDELEIGTYLPLITEIPNGCINVLNELDLEPYFPKNIYKYTDEIAKAMKIRNEKRKIGGSGAKWFNCEDGNGKALVDSYNKESKLPKMSINVTSQIPNKMPLDADFGFFIGAFLAEGCTSDTQVVISNNDEDYRKRIEVFCDKYSIGHHTVINENKKGWTSTDFIIHSKMMAKLMREMFGRLSHNKCVPDWVYNANDVFLKELINGYFSGDGCANTSKSITASTVSEKLIDGVIRILLKFGIFARKNKNKMPTKNNSTKVFKQSYELSIRCGHAKKFAETFNLVIGYKQERLNEIKLYDYRCENGQFDIIPGNNLKCLKGDIHRDKMQCIMDNSDDEEKEIIKNCINSKIYYDKIKCIEIIAPTKKYVYDLTVENDRTFVSGVGLFLFDTFHSAGIGGMGATTLGVPRIKELFSFSQNIKTPVMMIYFDKDIRKNKDLVEKIASSIKYTTIGDIRDKIDVYYESDPFNKSGFMTKDNVDNIFYPNNPTKYSCQADISTLPWLMRIALNKEKMMEKDITLLDIKSKFCHQWEKRFLEAKGGRKEDKQVLEKITQCAILSNNDNDGIPIIHIRFDMKDFNYGTITNFLDNFIDIFKLKGINEIQKINGINEERLVTFEDPDNGVKTDTQTVVYTAGVNMTALRYINGINLNKTKCNDVVEIFNKFGIEAARMALLKEIGAVFDTSGSPVNYQHISVLIDIMTNNGMLTSIDRHGMNRLETDPLARASFEKTVDQLLTAAVFGEVDHMKSVSSRIMAGLAIKGGTGLCNVILDTELLENSEYIDTANKYQKTFDDLTVNNIISDSLITGTKKSFMPEF